MAQIMAGLIWIPWWEDDKAKEFASFSTENTLILVKLDMEGVEVSKDGPKIKSVVSTRMRLNWKLNGSA